MKQVTKDMTIAEIIALDGGIIEILMKAGMHCAGCPSAQMETLAEAGFVHGAEIDLLVGEINDYLTKTNVG